MELLSIKICQDDKFIDTFIKVEKKDPGVEICMERLKGCGKTAWSESHVGIQGHVEVLSFV